MAKYHENGIGESLGDTFVTQSPLIYAGDIWFVNSDGGTDATAPAGKEKLKPLETLEQALDNADDGDAIVIADSHAETLTAPLTIDKRVLIVGCGRSSGRPTAKFTANMSSDSLFFITAAGVEIRNIWFEENAQANDTSRIYINGRWFRMTGCYVESDGNDDAEAITLVAESDGFAMFENNTFVCTAEDVSDVPEAAIRVGTAYDRISFKGDVFDGGTTGFSLGFALTQAAATSQFMAEEISRLRGADFSLHADTLGHAMPTTSTGNSRLEWG